MGCRIVVIQGHPDPSGAHFDHALAASYVEGAESGGHEVRRIDVGAIEFPLIRSRDDWQGGEPPAAIASAQADVLWAEHMVLVYPLWLGTMPALLKGFIEQLLRPQYAFGNTPGETRYPLRGRSARVVVTMGMPGFVYRGFFRAHSLKSLERNILHFVGIRPVRTSVVGSVEGAASHRERWLRTLRALGRDAR